MQTLAVCIIVLSLSMMALGWHVYRVTEALRKLQKRHRKLLRRTSNAFDTVGSDLDHLEKTVEEHRVASSRLFVQQGEINAHLDRKIDVLANIATGGGKVIQGPWKSPS